jgi:hypothetical protein
MVSLALPPADHLLIERDRGQFVPSRRRRMMANVRAERLLKIPAEPGPKLRIPGAAAQTRIVSKARIRLNTRDLTVPAIFRIERLPRASVATIAAQLRAIGISFDWRRVPSAPHLVIGVWKWGLLLQTWLRQTEVSDTRALALNKVRDQCLKQEGSATSRAVP